MEGSEIPVGEIEMGKSQARQRDVEEGLDELAESIRVLGLQQPVKVTKKSDGKYELVAGQRRFLAIKNVLKRKTIRAEVVDEKDPIRLKAISFAENFIRAPLHNPDIVDACVAFTNRYGSMLEASRQLGLKYEKVREYVKYDSLPVELKQMVDDKKVHVEAAHKAAKAATKPDSTIDVAKAIQLAPAIDKMAGSQKKKLLEEASEEPELAAPELIEKAGRGEEEFDLKVTLARREYRQLKKYAQDNSYDDEKTAAADLIIDNLDNKGYHTQTEEEHE